MASLNKVQIIGYVGTEPVSTVVGEQKLELARFTVGVSRIRGDEETDWFNVRFFGATVSKYIKPYVHKGDLVYIEGELHWDAYTDSQGAERKALSLVGASIIDFGTKDSSTANLSVAAVPSQTPPTQVEDMPF